MKFDLPDKVKEILNKFSASNYQAFIVGGAVRDLILGRDVKDWDFTTDATPEEILKLFPDGFYNNQFGTVSIKAEAAGLGVQIVEITTMRKEGEYSDSRHPDKISWTKDIKEDLGRRDFTVNAMALSSTGEVIDPFDGQQDIKDKLIRAVGNPEVRFHEDALRLMRAIRFATQLRFTIEEKTYQAVKDQAKLLQQISWERIRDELFKILESDYPYEGIIMLRNAGLLQIILPELEATFGIYQQGPKHDREYDIGEHSLLSLKLTPAKDPLVRLATLIHDVGKVKTFKTEKDGNVTFYGHDIVGGRVAKQIGERLKLSNKQTEKLIKLVRWHMFTINENQTDSAIRRFIKNVSLENIDDMLDLRVGDRLGGGTQTPTSWRMEKFKDRIKQVLKKPFTVADLKVNGKDVMETLQIKPGPKVGEILNSLFQEVLKDSSKNNKEYLLEKLKKLSESD